MVGNSSEKAHTEKAHTEKALTEKETHRECTNRESHLSEKKRNVEMEMETKRKAEVRDKQSK